MPPTSSPHDSFVKRTFTNLDHAADELRAVLPPALVARIDWSTLRIEPGSFVDEALRDRHTDLLFSMRTLDGHEVRLGVSYTDRVSGHEGWPTEAVGREWKMGRSSGYARDSVRWPDAHAIVPDDPEVTIESLGAKPVDRSLQEGHDGSAVLPRWTEDDDARVLRGRERTCVREVEVERDEHAPFLAAHASDLGVGLAVELLIEDGHRVEAGGHQQDLRVRGQVFVELDADHAETSSGIVRSSSIDAAYASTAVMSSTASVG